MEILIGAVCGYLIVRAILSEIRKNRENVVNAIEADKSTM